MSIIGLMRRLSLIGIDAIWQLSLGCLLMRTIASFFVKTGYHNIKGPISHVLLLILVHAQLPSCLFFWLLASLELKTMSLNIAQQFMKGMVKNYFGLSKILNKLKLVRRQRSGIDTIKYHTWPRIPIGKSRGFLASSLSTYDSSTLYTTLPHNLIKEKLT